MSERSDTLTGTQFAGYRIEVEIGRGGMGAVYRARDLELERTVALKVLAPELASNERVRGRFLRESRLAASLDHPHIVPIFQAGEAEGIVFLAMRFVEGGDLSHLVAEEGPLDPDRVVALVAQAASALDAAHEQGLVHRDVKPSNLLVGRSAGVEHCFLADFGLTKRTGSISGLTAPDQVIGTLDYIAPEQIRGEEVDGRADVYSLACVLYECLTGEAPFEKATDVAVLWAHVHEEPPLVTSLRPELPKTLDAVVARGLAKEPGQRYETCGELAAAAGAALTPGAPARRRRARAAIGALMALVVGAAVGISALLTSGSGPEAVAPNSVALIDTATNKVVVGIPVGLRPDAVAVGEDAIWVANTEDRTVSRIDRATRAVARTVSLDEYPSDLAVGGDSLWVALGPSTSLTWVSPANVATAPRPALGEGGTCGGPGSSVAFGGDSVWVTCEHADLGRLDPATGESEAIGYDAGLLTSPTAVSPWFTDVAFGLDRVWIVNRAANALIEVDPKAERKLREITVGRSPAAAAVGRGALWVACFEDDTVWRVDVPGSVEPVTPTPIPVGDGPADVAVGDNAVWVVNRNDGTVSRIDPQRNKVVATISIGEQPRRIAAGGGEVWVTVQASDDPETS